VVEPIRLHVPAKRYLCATDHTYWEALSDASKRSLQVQGGPFSPAEAEAFIALPYAPEAVQVRLWDDKAKSRGVGTQSLAHYLDGVVTRALRRKQNKPSWAWVHSSAKAMFMQTIILMADTQQLLTGLPCRIHPVPPLLHDMGLPPFFRKPSSLDRILMEDDRPAWQQDDDGYFKSRVSSRRLECDLLEKRHDYSGFHAFAEKLGEPTLNEATPRGRRGNWDVEKAREWQKQAEKTIESVSIESPPKPWEVHSLLDLTTMEDWVKVMEVTATAASDMSRGLQPALTDVNESDFGGATALHYAARAEGKGKAGAWNAVCCKAIVEAKAALDVVTSEGQTPLHWAAEANNPNRTVPHC